MRGVHVHVIHVRTCNHVTGYDVSLQTALRAEPYDIQFSCIKADVSSSEETAVSALHLHTCVAIDTWCTVVIISTLAGECCDWAQDSVPLQHGQC